jgi:hypothetical protein
MIQICNCKVFEVSEGAEECEHFTPTADVVEVKHGEWEHSVEKGTRYDHHHWICSLCGASAFTSGYEKYCHNCGADMRGETK